MTPEQDHALAVARRLVAAGVPVFAAPPDPTTSTGFRLPIAWETQRPRTEQVDRWQPGWALCAVMGRRLDLLDVDPRNGGQETREGLVAAGMWPTVYAVAETPSGGTHEFVAPLGTGSRDAVRDGLDVKSGTPEGTGRGFAFIAPTAKASKVTGGLVAYRWCVEPDLDALDDRDDSGQALAEMVRTARGRKRVGDLFVTVGDTRWPHAGPVPDGRRYPALRSYAGSLRRRDVHLDEALVLMRGRWQDCAQPFGDPFTWEQAEELLRDIYGRYAPDSVPAAVEDVTEAEVCHGERYIDWREFWATDRTETEWLVEPLLAVGQAVSTYSPPKVGKSLLWLEIGAALATGRPVLGNPSREPMDVTYVDHENTPDDLADRLSDLGYGPGDDLSRLHYSLLADWPPLDTAQGGQVLHTEVTATGSRLVILDTVSRSISGGENDADTFLALYRHTVRRLKQDRIAFVRLDHSGKDITKGQRGSSAKSADVDTVWQLLARGEDTLTLKREASRTGYGPPMLWLRRETSPLRHVIDSADEAHERDVERIIDALDDLDVAIDAGRPAASKALREANIKARNARLSEAMKRRRLRDNLLSESGTAVPELISTTSGTAVPELISTTSGTAVPNLPPPVPSLSLAVPSGEPANCPRPPLPLRADWGQVDPEPTEAAAFDLLAHELGARILDESEANQS